MAAEIDRILVILDTNVLLRHLALIQQTVLNPENSQLIFVVPFIVIHELDLLKDAEKTRSQASAAMRFIQSSISSDRGSILCQNHSEVYSERLVMSNDDKILDCAIYFGRLWRVVVWTEDRNLAIKAQTHHLGVISGFARVLPVADLQKKAAMVKVADEMVPCTLLRPTQQTQPMVLDVITANDFWDQLDEIVEHARLDEAVRRCFEQYIGKNWEKLVIEYKVRWQVSDILVVIVKYWNVVFANFLPRSSKHMINSLLRSLLSLRAAWDIERAHTICHGLSSFLLLFGVQMTREFEILSESLTASKPPSAADK